MLPYVLVTGIIALLALGQRGRAPSAMAWALAFVMLWVFVGLRHHVGMDWNNYLGMIQRANRGTFLDALDVAEPGYVLLLRLAGQTGTGVYGAYFVGTAIFLAGLFHYARTSPEPWLALLVAMPFLVIFISMSAARQSIAIGILLWLVADWNRASLIRRCAFIMLASMFHTSAVIFLVLAAVDMRASSAARIVFSGVAVIVAIYALNSSGKADYYGDLYIKGAQKFGKSEGAYYHTALNGLPAIYAMLQTRARRAALLADRNHFHMALIAAGLILAVPFASAAVGRITLYLFPVSMRILSSLPALQPRGRSMSTRMLLCLAMLAICAGWLALANSSLAHRHYRNVLFVPEAERDLCCH